MWENAFEDPQLPRNKFFLSVATEDQRFRGIYMCCCYVVSFFGKNPLRFPSTLALVSGKQSKGSGSGPTFPNSVTLIG